MVCDRMGFVVLDLMFQIVIFGEYEVFFDICLCLVDSCFVFDQGEYIFMIFEYGVGYGGLFCDYFNLFNIILVYYKGKIFWEYDFEVLENKVFDVGVIISGDEIIVIGIYGVFNQ